MLKTILKFFSSLWLTVILLSLAMILIYAGTLAQVDTDVWKVQGQYFHQLIAWIRLQDFVPRFSSRPVYIKGSIPFPGGYFIGGLFLVNLIAAHSIRFKFSPKDFWLIPQAMLLAAALNYWQIHYTLPVLLAAVALGILFVVTLFLIHAKRAGIIIIHLGLILLLVGEAITSRAAKEMRMDIQEGSYANYLYDIRRPELAIVDKSDAKQDHHVVIPPSLLETGATLNDRNLPFTIKVDKFFANSREVPAKLEPSAPFLTDTMGDWTVQELKGVSGVQGGAIDLPSAFVTLSKNGQKIGSYLVTVMTRKPHTIEVDGKSYDVVLRFEREYKPYTVYLKKFSFDRYTGTNVPRNYSSDVNFVDPAHDFTRDVRIWMNHPLRYRGETFYQSGFDEQTEKATVLQVVRNPAMTLPYTTVAIAGIGLVIHFGVSLLNFLSRRDLSGAELALGLIGLLAVAIIGSIAYVIAGWISLLILIAGSSVVAGSVVLVRLQGRAQPSDSPTPPPLPKPAKTKRDKEGRYELAPQSSFFTARRIVPLSLLALCLFYVIGHAVPRPLSPNYDMDTFARIPLSYEGRVQPMDSLARNALKVLRGRESALEIVKDKDNNDDEKKIQPVPWLLDTLTGSDRSAKYKIFVIDHPDVKADLNLDERQKYFSFEDLIPSGEKLSKIYRELGPVREKKTRPLSQVQLATLEVADRVMLYSRIRAFAAHHVVPPEVAGGEWLTFAESDTQAREGGITNPIADAYLQTLRGYAQNDPATFNVAVQKYARLVEDHNPKDSARVTFENWYNRFDPIVMSMVFYMMVFLLAAFSWMGFTKPLARSAFWILCLTVVVHSFALAARIFISGRPPVTNLASSAIFIGWGMVIFSICLELIYRNGVGSVLAAFAGFPTLFIAQKLSLDGDTLKVLQAVLDTNVWLGTHVVCITMGYAATFLAGLIGILYIVLGIFTPLLDTDSDKHRRALVATLGVAALAATTKGRDDAVPLGKTLGRMMYGITCFAILFSFVGTILGGLWADQSWGRFWGWDPKENGAVLIVLANALFLHARWGGIFKERGLAVLAVFGNIITAWSYFGTNMLGVGLHSYGFMASAITWLNIFIGSQLCLMAIASFIPIASWQSTGRVTTAKIAKIPARD